MSKLAPQCVIVGLGNPGKQYEMTRHNIGFQAVKHLATRLGLTWRRNEKMNVEYCSTVVKPDKNALQQCYEKARAREQNRIFHEQHGPLINNQSPSNTINRQSKDAAVQQIHVPEEIVAEQARLMLERQFIFSHAEVHLVLPQSFMNLSGTPIYNYISSQMGQPGSIKMLRESSNRKAPFRMLVVYDDVSIPFGQMRLKFKGGDGGHNGMSSIEKRFGTERLHRLRLGVAPNERIPGSRGYTVSGSNLADYVLARFSSGVEQPLLPRLFTLTSQLMLDYVLKDMLLVMNEANKVDLAGE